MKSKHLEKEQVKAVLKGLKAMRAEPFALLLELILRSGCRTAEILTIKNQDINLTKSLLYIESVKGSKPHEVPVDDEFLTQLKAFLGNDTLKAKFPTMTAESLKRTLRREWPRWRFKLLGQGYEHVSLHGLRASFAVLLYRKTSDILLVQAMLGHKNLNSTAHYIRIVDVEERASEILKAIG